MHPPTNLPPGTPGPSDKLSHQTVAQICENGWVDTTNTTLLLKTSGFYLIFFCREICRAGPSFLSANLSANLSGNLSENGNIFVGEWKYLCKIAIFFIYAYTEIPNGLKKNWF